MAVCVFCCTQKKMVNGQAGSRAREESDMQAIDVKGTVIGPLHLSMELQKLLGKMKKITIIF